MYHQNYCKLVGTALPRQSNTWIAPQISSIQKLEEDDSATTFFITEKQQKIMINISLGSLNVREQYKQWNIKNY